MKTNLVSLVQKQIRARRGTLRDLATRSGVPYSTLVKIAQGSVRNPRIETVEALLRVFGVVCAVPPIATATENEKAA